MDRDTTYKSVEFIPKNLRLQPIPLRKVNFFYTLVSSDSVSHSYISNTSFLIDKKTPLPLVHVFTLSVSIQTLFYRILGLGSPKVYDLVLDRKQPFSSETSNLVLEGPKPDIKSFYLNCHISPT